MPPPPRLFTLPPHLPFLDAVAMEWLAHAESLGGGPLDVAAGLILLPTRRAARALADAFLRVSGGRALLLPRITALGGLDEAPLALAGALDLPPAVGPMRRLAALTRMILAMSGEDGAPRTADRAWRLATELARLMDEAERAEIDLAARLPDAAEPEFAAHWARTLEFLRIVTAAWPHWLAEQGLMNPAARQVALLDAQAAAWQRDPPRHRVLLAGVTGAIPCVARLAETVARLPAGSVLLPGLDARPWDKDRTDQDWADQDPARPDLSDQDWAALDDSHYQAGLQRLLSRLGLRREEVRVWPVAPLSRVPPDRAVALRRALLPGRALADWQDRSPADITGLYRLEPADQQEEALAAALVLREALETPGATAALVTPDRELAGRVALELSRFGIVADDSAGEKLADTPPAVFLRLLARAITEELAPVALLALLKHPLTALGLAPAECRAAARDLELACLRGPRPEPGLTGLRLALDRTRTGLTRGLPSLLDRIERALEPALRIAASVVVSPAQAMDALIDAAQRTATTDEASGQARLWSGEEGDALAERLASVRASLDMLPEQPRAVLPGLLDAVLDGAVVRSRRALRGRDGVEHPRLFIWGLLEGRLQSADVMVLGGLVEGIWPASGDPGPWLSRPMRTRVGLPSPEEAVGQAAHDFASLACAAPVVVLSCPRRRDGAPAVPSRWLIRLEMFLAGRDSALPKHPAVAWARALDQPAGATEPVPPPAPCPPVCRRPRRLSVTEIETWLRDPYAIYARHILRLRALDPLEQETDAADYGSLVHGGLHRFLQRHGARWPADGARLLREELLAEMLRAGLRESLRNWWAPRLERIAEWVADTEVQRRSDLPLASVWSELSGTWEQLRPGGTFTLVGRADRVERRADGTLAILDYKTGQPPGTKEIEAGLAPQLTLEAAMVQAGAFGAEQQGAVAELSYWHLSGGYVPGQVIRPFRGDKLELAAAVKAATQAVGELIDTFDDPARCYLSQPHPGRAPRFSDYAQLARVAEWVAVGEDG